MLKKVIALALVAAMSVTAGVAGTLAYLTSQDSDVNVMTLGNVQIEQIEQERDENGELVDFTQAKPAFPAVGEPAWDDDMLDVNGTKVKVFDNTKFKNTVDKIVTVKNTGKSDAYFRTIIAIEDPFETNNVGINVNGNDDYYGRSGWYTVVIDGVTYSVIAYTYEDTLEPGDVSPPSLLQAYIASTATNEDMKRLGDTWEIMVLSQAVQTEGFDNAKTALDTAFGDVTAENAAKWFAGMGNVYYVEAPVVENGQPQLEGEAAAEILKKLENGQNLIVDEKMDLLGFDTTALDAKDATVTLSGTGSDAYGYLAFLPDAQTDVTVSNLNVTGSGFVEVGHYGQGGGQYTLNNVKIENLGATLNNENKGFHLGCAFMGFGDTILNNCVIKGTTAVQDGVMPVDLGCGQAWSGYQDGNDNKISTTVNGGEYGTIYCWSHALVTINGAKVDTLYASPINGTVTIKAGTKIDTLMVDYGTSDANNARLQKLTIEEGAAIGKITFSAANSTTVQTFNSVAEWNAFVANFGTNA